MKTHIIIEDNFFTLQHSLTDFVTKELQFAGTRPLGESKLAVEGVKSIVISYDAFNNRSQWIATITYF